MTVTDRGDYVLDNRSSRIQLFSDTGYIFFSRQSQANPRAWTVVELDARLAMAGIIKTPSATMSKTTVGSAMPSLVATTFDRSSLER